MNKLFLWITINLLASIVVLAVSYGFIAKATGHLGGQITFEFYDKAGKKINANIARLTVSKRVNGRWQAIWSLDGKRENNDAIVYGRTDAGSHETIPPQPFSSGPVYAAFASDSHGGSAMEVFQFRKDGVMTFPTSLD
jgi:hypothetical protein